MELTFGTPVGQQTYGLSNAQRLINLHQRTTAFTSELGKKLRSSQFVNDVGNFLSKIGQEKLIRFYNDLQPIFDNRAEVTCNDNIQGLAKQLNEICMEHNIPPHQAWAYVGNVLQLSVTCSSPDEVKTLFRRKVLPEGTMMQVVRLRPRFKGFLQDMLINFNWMNICICELQIKLDGGNASRTAGDQEFIMDMIRTCSRKSIGELAEAFDRRKNEMVRLHRVSSANFTHSMETRPLSLQEAIKTEGGDYKNYTD